MALSCRLCWALAVVAALVASAFAQEPGKDKDGKDPEDKKFQIPFWESDQGFQVRAAMVVAGEADGMRAANARVALSENVPLLPGWDLDFNGMLPLSRRFLDAIQDGGRIPNLQGKEVKDLKIPDRGLWLAYLQAISRSNAGKKEFFEASAKKHDSVVYRHLAANPKFYRGEIIAVTGTLHAITKHGSPRGLESEGIQHVYEGWLKVPYKNAPLYSLSFTHLPDELADKSKEYLQEPNPELEVTFYGYFLAHVNVPADVYARRESNCPWMVGRSFIVHPPQKDAKKSTKEAEEPVALSYILYSVGGIIIAGLLMFVLHLYFKRGDQRLQKQLDEIRDKHSPFSLEPADESPKQPEAPSPPEPLTQ